MSTDARLHQIEERMAKLENSYRRLLSRLLKALGGDIEEETSARARSHCGRLNKPSQRGR